MDGRLGVVAPFEPGRMTAMQPIAVLRDAAADRAKVELVDEWLSTREAHARLKVGGATTREARTREFAIFRAVGAGSQLLRQVQCRHWASDLCRWRQRAGNMLLAQAVWFEPAAMRGGEKATLDLNNANSLESLPRLLGCS